METALRSLKIEGFKSVHSAALDLSSGVTLLVGANGAGKSNIVGAFEMLGHIVDGQVNDYVLQLGGFDRILHRSADPDQQADAAILEVWGERDSLGRSNGYRVELEGTDDDQVILSEEVSFHGNPSSPDPFTRHLGRAKESQLRPSYSVAGYSLDVLSQCRVFHFDDASGGAPPKRRTDVGNNLTLMKDGRNVAAVLFRMRDEVPDAYQEVLRSIRAVAPFFEDFVLKPRGETVILRWREKGIDDAFSASALSDGTLRFICLSVLLQQPNPPATIVLDEPELGLHPYAIRQLAEQLHFAAENRRIVAATQSVTLMNQFTVDEVAVVERGMKGTQVHRPSENEFAHWLEDYSLGELWEKNLLGGNPSRFAV